MGNLFSKFRPGCRRRRVPGPGRGAPAPLARDASQPGRVHPAATPRPFRGLFRRNARRRPSPGGIFVAPKRPCPLPRAAAAPLGVLPAVGWGLATRKTPVLPTRNPPRFGHPSSVRIPPPSRAFTLRLPSPREPPAVPARKPIPATLPEEPEVPAQEGPRRAKKGEDPVQIKGEDDEKRAPLSSGEASSTSRSQGTQEDLASVICSPGPLEGNVHHRFSENSVSEKAQASPASSCLEGPATPSTHSEAGCARHLGKPDPDAAAPPEPVAGCSLLPQKLAGEVPNEEPPPSSLGPSTPLMSATRMPDGKPFGIPPRSAAPPRAARNRPCKRKMSIPLLLPLPPSLPLLWDRGELPPPAKLPCLSVEGALHTLEKSPEYKRNSRILEDKTETMTNSSITQPAPSFSPPVETTDSLPLATYTDTSQVPAPLPIPDLADLATGPLILPVPPLSTTPKMDERIAFTIPNSPLALPADLVPLLRDQSNEKGGSCHSVIGAAPPTSDPPTPPSLTPFFKPPVRRESPISMHVDSPPPLSFLTLLPIPSTRTSVITSKPMNSTSVISTITTNTSGHLTSQTTVDPEVVNMDTTAPSQVVIFTSSLSSRVSSLPNSQIHCSAEQRHTGKTSVYTSPLPFIFHNTTPNFNQFFGKEATPQPKSGAPDGQQQKASLPGACVFLSLPIIAHPVTSTLVNSASTASSSKPPIETNAMNTTPPSKAVILQSASVSKKKYLPFYLGLPGSGNSRPSGNIASVHASTSLPTQSVRGTTTTSNYALNPGATAQPKFGAPDGLQQKTSLPSAHDFLSLPIMVPPDTSTLVSNASAASLAKPAIDASAMNTTPPSKTVILQSAFVSRKEYIQFYVGLPGSGNILHSDNIASAQVSTSFPAQAGRKPVTTSSHPLNTESISHSTLGATDGQQKSDSSFILGNPATPAPAIGLPSPSAQPLSGSIIPPGFAELTSPYSALGTPINAQPAKSHNASAFPNGTAKTSGFRVATGMPGTGDSTSLVGNTILGPQVIMGPGTPMDGGSIGFTMSAPGPSSTSGELSTGQEQSGTPSTTSVFPFGRVAWDPTGHSMAAAPQGANNIPVFGYTSAATYIPGLDPPTQNSGSGMGEDGTKPMVGGPCVPAFQQCILQHTWTEKKFYTSSTHHYEQETYVRRHVCFQLP
uniref:Nuclear pore associated protein 1 n=1 Tax=Chlorocebus sabaeus TaxID=60711 RepID=A0A0D9SBZ5_CHLSB